MANGERGRGKQRGGRSSRGGRGHTAFVPAANRGSRVNLGFRSEGNGQQTFSLQEEARNTGNRPDFWKSDIKLRHSAVNFVSAGRLEGDKPADHSDAEAQVPDNNLGDLGDITSGPDRAFADMNIDDQPPVEDGTFYGEPALATVAAKDGPESVAGDLSGGEYFMVDVTGSRSPIRTGMAAPIIRVPSPSPSNSSEEVILFTGRNPNGDRTNETRATSPCKTPVTEGPNVEPDSNGKGNHTAASMPRPATSGQNKPSADNSHHISARSENSKETDDDELLADYISNLQESGQLEDLLENSLFSARELGDLNEGHQMPSKKKAPLPRESVSPMRHLDDEWATSDLHDFDDLSTSEGIFGAIQQILSKRERSQELQYLVVWEGHTIDDARWIHRSALTMAGADEHIRIFEENEKVIPQYTGHDSNRTDSVDSESADDDGTDEGTDEEEEDRKDQEDLELRKIERMTDEKIASLLAKQEELGMGSSELVLFDDDDGDDEIPLEEHYTSFRSAKRHLTKERGSKRPKGEVPSASLVADAYDNFDVMDWERTSLQKRPKGRRAEPLLGLSDSELEATLRSTWTHDRDKKKARKQEREELRAEGLLGRNKTKPDLKAKYKEGMTMDEIKDEITRFLISDHQTLPLPPMRKDERRLVHEIANAFGLKSKSVGNGLSRSPNLYKTRRSNVFDEDTLGVIKSRMNSSRFLPRMDKKGKRGAASLKQRAGGGGANNAGVTYRDGEVVGAAAPELGVENKGRAMLEKMGWSSGSGLGSINNKGILQPVAHVVKVSKAGLG
ncbi:MAG: hypothetical protein M1837_005577 [Sclerophora amabilis]|nr:MAG: hypothetical protein M1837_005577 [Sclerophora amabilis]